MNDKQKEIWEQLKAARAQKKQLRKEKFEEENQKHNEKKQSKLADKKKNKEYYKLQKNKIKELKIERKNKIKNLKNLNLSKESLKEQKIEIYDEYNEKIILIKNDILDRKFEFGKKYKTFNWKLLKWMYGVKKEFNRIIWSNPINTFKYLAIIVVLVLFLSGIFIAIDAIVNTFN